MFDVFGTDDEEEEEGLEAALEEAREEGLGEALEEAMAASQSLSCWPTGL